MVSGAGGLCIAGPHHEGWNDDIPRTQILCTWTEQTSDPFDVAELLRGSPSDEPWQRCFVRADQVEPDGCNWTLITHLPGIHVVGKTGDDAIYEIAVDGSYIPWLLRHGFPFTFESGCNALTPRRGDLLALSWEAIRQTQLRFLQTAAEGMRSDSGRGLAQYYRHHYMEYPTQRMRIEWLILTCDIENATPETIRQFLQCCVLLGLNSLDALDSPSALELIGKDQDAWIKHFLELCDEKLTQELEDDLATEMHKISLLRRLFEFVDGEEDEAQHELDPTLSASDNFEMYGSLLGINGSRVFGILDVREMLSAFSRSEIAGDKEWDIAHLTSLTERMRRCLRIACPGATVRGVPAHLSNNLPYATVDDTLALMMYTYCAVPSLDKPENGILMLVCHGASKHTVSRVLCEWATSEDGRSVYKRTMRGLQEVQAQEQLVLSLLALLCYQRLLPYAADEIPHLASGSCLWSFGSLMDGRESKNERTVLERMAHSVRRVTEAKGSCPAVRNFFDIVLGKATPQSKRDWFSDQYWSRRVGAMTHRAAWEEMNELGLPITGTRWDWMDEKAESDGGWILV